ncbi:hypothetical protein [Streptodolium elevatio]
MASCQSDVYFVSADKNAFGTGADLSQDLLKDLGGPGDPRRFHYCPGMDRLLAMLASKRAHRLGRSNLAASDKVRTAAMSAMTHPDVDFELTLGIGVISSPGTHRPSSTRI